MKIAAIKQLIEKYNLEELSQAETAIENGELLPFEVEGEDDGEKFTHILAAIDILHRIKEEGKDPNTALREFTQRVRNSIH